MGNNFAKWAGPPFPRLISLLRGSTTGRDGMHPAANRGEKRKKEEEVGATGGYNGIGFQNYKER